MYKQIVQGAFDKARLLIDPTKEKSFQLAENFADRILRSIPYGDKDLTTHSTYLDEAAKFDSDYTDLALKKLKNKPKLDAERNKLTIKTRWKNFNSIEITEEMTIDQRTQVQQQKQTEYKNLLNDPLFGGEEEQKYIQQLGESDNYNLLNEIIPAMENKISLGVFDGYDEVLEKEIAHIEMNHATLDDEAVKAIKELKTFARNSKGLGEKVETSKNKIMKIVNDNLGTSTKASFFSLGKGKGDFQTSTKINFEVQKQVTKYFKDYIKEKNRLPSSLEVQKMEEQFTIQSLGANDVGDFEEIAKQQYPDTINPFLPLPKPVNLNRTVPDGSFGIDSKKDDDFRNKGERGSVDSGKDNNFLESGMNFEGGAFTPSTPEDEARERKLNQTEKLDEILKGIDKKKKIPQAKINEMLLAVGFKPEEAKIMAAVAMAESAGNPMIDTVKSGLDPEKKNEFSIGLFQLNMIDAFLEERLKLFGIESTDELYDPIVNVIAAKRLYDQQGVGAWSAYKNNSYKKFLTD